MSADLEPWGDETAEPREWLPPDEPRNLGAEDEPDRDCAVCGFPLGYGPPECGPCEAYRDDSRCPGCNGLWRNLHAPCPECGMTIEDVAERAAAQRRKPS